MKLVTLYTANNHCDIQLTESGGEYRLGEAIWNSPTHDSEALENECDAEPTELATFYANGNPVAEISGSDWRDLESKGLVEEFAAAIYEGKDAQTELATLIGF